MIIIRLVKHWTSLKESDQQLHFEIEQLKLKFATAIAHWGRLLLEDLRAISRICYFGIFPIILLSKQFFHSNLAQWTLLGNNRTSIVSDFKHFAKEKGVCALFGWVDLYNCPTILIHIPICMSLSLASFHGKFMSTVLYSIPPVPKWFNCFCKTL